MDFNFFFMNRSPACTDLLGTCRSEKKYYWLVEVWRHWHLNHNFLWRREREEGGREREVWFDTQGASERLKGGSVFWKLLSHPLKWLTVSATVLRRQKKKGVGVGEGCEVEIGKLRGRERKMLGNCGTIVACECVAFCRHVNLEPAKPAPII